MTQNALPVTSVLIVEDDAVTRRVLSLAIESEPSLKLVASLESVQSALEWLKSRKLRLLAASPNGDEIYSNVNLREPVAIAVGTEDAGLTDFWLQNADVKVKIPMMGKVNSLNVSVSTALIVYEAIRQRS